MNIVLSVLFSNEHSFHQLNIRSSPYFEALSFKQNNLHVSGSKAALVACALDFSRTGTRHNERNSANDSNTEFLSSDSEYDSDSHTSTSENNSDLDSDDSETDGFLKHSYEVLFVPDDDIQQVRSTLTEA